MKKLIYSFWTAPLKERWSSYSELIDLDTILMDSVQCLYLSVLNAKKWGFEIEIYTDHESKYLLKDLPVNYISTELSFLSYKDTWIEGKLLAISKQTEPFIYIDWDIIITKKEAALKIQHFEEDVLIQSIDAIKQHPEDEVSYERIQKLQHFVDFSPFLVDGFHKKNSFYANTSVLAFNNLIIRDKYVDNFLKCLTVVRNNNLGDFSKIIDQYLFYTILNKTKASYKLIFEDHDKMQREAIEMGYTHLTFLSKYSRENQKKIKNQIKIFFPEHSFLIDKKTSKKKLKISLCTVVMNRFDHVIHTLKNNLEVIKKYKGHIDINVFDYNSTDGLEEYLFEQKWFTAAIKKKQIYYYKNYDAKYYHRTLPKNMIHYLAKGAYLINIDADNFIDKQYLDYCLDLIDNEDNFFLRPSIHNTSGTFGRIMIHKADFKNIGGYNLNIKNYGFEDSEITLRLREEGVKQLTTPKNLTLKFIDHSDKLRLAHEEPVIFDKESRHNPHTSDCKNRNLEKPLKFTTDVYKIELFGFGSKGNKYAINFKLASKS